MLLCTWATVARTDTSPRLYLHAREEKEPVLTFSLLPRALTLPPDINGMHVRGACVNRSGLTHVKARAPAGKGRLASSIIPGWRDTRKRGTHFWRFVMRVKQMDAFVRFKGHVKAMSYVRLGSRSSLEMLSSLKPRFPRDDDVHTHAHVHVSRHKTEESAQTMRKSKHPTLENFLFSGSNASYLGLK